MKTFWTLKTAYAAALMAAALSGSLIATATKAQAQTARPASAAAKPAETQAVTLSSDVKVERVIVDAAGKESRVLKNPKEVIVVPGDKLVFTLNYSNEGAEPAAGFRATNPMPGPVQFVAVEEEWAEISVDGGQRWGQLKDMTVKAVADAASGAAEIVRPAVAEDVTHVRWVFTGAIAPGAKGKVSFRGVVK